MNPVNSSSMKSMKSKKPAESQPSSSNHGTPSDWYEMLYADQVKAADFLIQNLTQNRGCGLLSDPGTGKTIVSMAVIEHFMPSNLLIVAPLTSLEVTWGKRLRTLYDEISNTAHEYHGGVLLVGFEHFRQNIKKITKIAEKYKFNMAIVDESQGLKHRGSNQSRATRRLRLRIPKRMILSGTPIDESPMDMWAQMRFIAPDVLGDVWAAPRDRRKYVGPYFEEEFCRKAGFMGYGREFIPEKLPEFLRRISPYLFRLENDMEQPDIIPVYVELGDKQRAVYDQMADHGILRIKDKKSKAGLKPVRDLRCFQIVGGSLTMDDGSVEWVGQAKQEKLSSLVKQLDRPVVFCRFLSELEEVRDVLEEHFDRVEVLSGAIKDKKNNKARTRLLEDFQAKKVDAMAVQARTGGVSIEFTATNILVFYSMGYSYIDFQQIIARFRRYGQEKRVRVYLIIARNTIDEEPLKRVIIKGETVNPIMKHIKEHSMTDEVEKPKAAKKAAKKTAPKKVAKKAAKAAPKKAKVEKLAIGIDYIADKLDLTEGTARMKLRDHNVAKAGKSYGWATKAEADKVLAKIQKAA